MGVLREKMIEEMNLRNIASRTPKSTLRQWWGWPYIIFYSRIN